ncbi:hypothetical protein TTHERM_00877080 (macronuclear) [Tetrahymena thermophila SB210]|uniref:Uncharacterized protein n=1 Tax=Tetrahymena thermophila (strain SB210) TaxID=312017 RepID=Q23H34_TETTS|nr:hypothetical protein TTHERM_00877080 [Tetrahymena thermophila SB210]EAR95813.2 hypothetical protein TTHERM_00877080 [Tetrahymena thermophila SB210]|eukprot:XP_001016058.2 hypothetical protein TTHERM_00877080 [Tetrahymena thermophila SB210]
MSQKPKYIIFHVELPQDKSILANQLDQIEVFKNYISVGASQLLLHKKSAFTYLSSLFSFEGESYEQSSENKHQKFDENKKKVINESEFDEEQNEIRFIKNPNYYHEFSNNLQTLLVTNSQKTVTFANSVKIDYSQIEYNDGEISKILREDTSDIELIIIDYSLKSNCLKQLTSVAQEVSTFEQQSNQVFINLIVSPFLSEEETADYLNPQFRLNNLKNEKSASIISKILPVQTWETYQGKINQEFVNAAKVSSLSVFYDKNGCRQDKLDNFSSVKQNLDKLGFAHINAEFLFREITFKLGKLPKYGA